MVLGTVAGMSVWSVLYASLGAASRALLDAGEDLDVLMAGGGRLTRAAVVALTAQAGLWQVAGHCNNAVICMAAGRSQAAVERCAMWRCRRRVLQELHSQHQTQLMAGYGMWYRDLRLCCLLSCVYCLQTWQIRQGSTVKMWRWWAWCWGLWPWGTTCWPRDCRRPRVSQAASSSPAVPWMVVLHPGRRFCRTNECLYNMNGDG